ncbi:uncharacterized protein LOC115447440 [Manduca sexta]|uniref:Uncharacterized protein n=1 Tax=Manduca sexta TaxID=7130 RepID=A0A921ZE50_MANSE|nr:uncharacterized protein LOC115447440 [Manduca sexta]KAG6456313.1 hypothetical protein O3G_MSEX009675 [Manduca sexta]
MSDSDSFSSLMALVESHLSKTSITETKVNDIDERIHRAVQIPSMNGMQSGASGTPIARPNQRLPLPDFGISSSEINDVLAGQISNMLIAKEKKKQEEKYKLEEEMKKLKLNEDEDELIDLMAALQTPFEKPPPVEPSLSSSSSLMSLLEENTKDFECSSQTSKKPSLEETLPEVLPCKTDMSYILFENIPQAKGSAFALVLTSRYRRVAEPYLREKVPHNIKRFDFKTKSPCDLYKEKLRKPTKGNPNYVDIMDLVMG